MRRRTFLTGASALALAPVAGLCRVSEIGGAPLPYSEVPAVSIDADRCLAFFQFSCPHCRNIHGPLAHWGQTLPRGISFEFLPVVGADRGQVMAARAWYAVSSKWGDRLPQFADAAYRLLQDDGLPAESGETWTRAASAAAISPQSFKESWGNVRVDAITRAMDKLAVYRIASTPTLSICGNRVISLDNVKGDQNLFLRLASGLLSMSLRAAASPQI